MSGRDPFPSPKYESGFSLSGFRPQQISNTTNQLLNSEAAPETINRLSVHHSVYRQFDGIQTAQLRKPFDKPTHLAQMEEPWRRLHYAATLSSSRRSAAPYEQQPQVPRDSLDFQLRSVYDHHSDFFWSKNQMLYQRDTISEDDGRKLEKQDEVKVNQKEDMRVWVDPQRISIYSIK